MKTFKICYVSSEVAPFASTIDAGGLADTSNALPIALKDMDQDVRLMTPKYKLINERKYVLREVIRLREVNIELEGEAKVANGKTAFLPNSKVHVYFLTVPEYFDRKGYYIDPQTGTDYIDNTERFAYFCKGILETLKLLYWQPDIIHCNDWTTAIIPFYLKFHYKDDDFFQNTRTLLTVHNFSNQGIFPKETASKIGIAKEYIAAGREFELDGKLNLLKGGLHYADVITTVSERAAEEVLADPKAAFGLHKTLKAREKDIFGVVRGIDHLTWNPETDKNITDNYGSKALGKKSANKKTFCKELNLDNDLSIPLIAIISELTEENGLGLVLDSIKSILKLKAQLVVMGAGESKYSEELKKLGEQHPNKLVYQERFDTRLTHLALAGADILLIPAKAESIEVYLLEGMRYGTIPVIRETGGYRDFIIPLDPETGKGNAFIFRDFKKTAMINALQEALNTFENKKNWAKIQKNCMRGDFSWESSAKKYLKLYEKAAKKK
jgi:starch synthase